MPISNRIILTDVDGVLLEWENHFTQWMLQRSYYNDKGERVYPYKLLPDKQNTYEMAERFGLEINQIRKEIREFNKSAWMATQSPMPESQTWVKLLHAEGWTFIPITSQTSDIPAQEVRKKRLQDLFGEDTFKNYFILDTGMDKDSVLAEFHGTNLFWIEDKPKNALTGLKFGLRPIIINHAYNQDFKHPEIIKVNNWRDIHKLAHEDLRRT
tara:strand:+ start:382 stop:1017 length:636 start_codon:yes stop_codon:yes gene_type:complete